MKKLEKIKHSLTNGDFNKTFEKLYCTKEFSKNIERYLNILNGYEKTFGNSDEIRLFSAPGRTEIGGNHTDHQNGCVIAASINLDVIAAVSINNENIIRVHILMFGGGPAIRAHTYRVFHRHNIKTIIDQIVDWSIDSTAQLGCTPSTLAVGIGRSHYEATALMLQALIYGNYDKQSDLEQEITNRVNQSHVGALGLGGNNTVLATFMNVGPQRASGVRIVCVRPCCCFEPRIASCIL